jgi:hypothetical protein
LRNFPEVSNRHIKKLYLAVNLFVLYSIMSNRYSKVTP